VGQVFVDFGFLPAIGKAEGVKLNQFLQVLARHTVAASVSSSRNAFKALRTQVFTVPSVCFNRSAISFCERPS